MGNDVFDTWEYMFRPLLLLDTRYIGYWNTTDNDNYDNDDELCTPTAQLPAHPAYPNPEIENQSHRTSLVTD